jgi:hypothetical protein
MGGMDSRVALNQIKRLRTAADVATDALYAVPIAAPEREALEKTWGDAYDAYLQASTAYWSVWSESGR